MLGQTNKFLREVAEPSLRRNIWRNVDFEADHRVEMLYTHNNPICHVKHKVEYDGRILLSEVTPYSIINKIRSFKTGFAFMSYCLEA
ncbi:hypothetical protein EC957_001879 [Mortierella hygrophila]|uniref:Uncharacterized protein n=1 Tax=Mortierella hygrophila TaxID=979708 RepID=A0A9P6K1Y5_9FUNG|nr:hypothetical protein EC957_001879 [Mortierella hygrophila]